MYNLFTEEDDDNQAGAARPTPSSDYAAAAARTELKVWLHQKLLEVLNLAALDKLTRGDLVRELLPIVRSLLEADGIQMESEDVRRLTEEVIDELLGLGPLEPYLKDETVTDILVNTHRAMFVERFGQIEPTPARFKDEAHLMRVIQKIVAAVGRRVDESQPWVDARTADGSRVNVMVPPCAVDGPLLSIRKFAKTPYTMPRLIDNATVTAQIASAFALIVAARRNVLISGGTGSGKTTLLNAMSSYISNKERIITIEDTAELQLQQSHVCRLETRQPNIEGAGEVTQRDLLKNALRMRPDRIIVGEVRGAEVLDMLQAMNTGHDGSMTSIHANTPRDALTRLEHMVGMTGIDLPLSSLRPQIASALHVVIQIQRMSDGKRRVVSVQEVLGMEAGSATLQEIFRFERAGVDKDGNVLGSHKATGVKPRFLQVAADCGLPIPLELQSLM
jgi:pilus assembly protein CpaF